MKDTNIDGFREGFYTAKLAIIILLSKFFFESKSNTFRGLSTVIKIKQFDINDLFRLIEALELEVFDFDLDNQIIH